jgi:tetratricopeptide (TPR) repeat protein
MDLTAPQRQQLHTALLTAFPARADLAQLLWAQLSVNLNMVVSEQADLGETVRRVIEWAIAQGRLAELMQGAVAQNPGSQPLQTLAATLPPQPLSPQATARVALVPPPPPEPWAARPEFAVLQQWLLAGGRIALSAEGRGGIGKTALAQKLAWDPAVRAAYPDGVLWVALGPQPDVPGALAALAAAFAVDVRDTPELATRAARVRALLVSRRCLLIVDDVWDAETAGLFRALAPAAALLTTRQHDVARAFAPQGDTTLAPLDDDAAVALLAGLLTAPVTAATLARVARVAGGLPLTLRVLAPLLDDEARMGWGLDSFLAQLDNPVWRGQQLGARLDTLVRASLDHLPEPGAQAAFVTLAVFGARPATFGLPAATAVWATDPATARERLMRLVSRNLVDAVGGGRFSLHQSLADLTTARLPATDPAYQRHAAFYLALVSGDREDWRTIAAEVAQIRRAWEAVAGDAEQVLAFIWAMRRFQKRQGLWREGIVWAERGVGAAQALRRPQDEGTMLNEIGWFYNALGERDRALEYLEHALVLRQQVGDPRWQARTLTELGSVYHGLGDARRALEYYDQALAIQETLADQEGKARTLNNLGLAYSTLGELQRALACYEEARPIFEALGDRAGQATALNNIGEVYRAWGEPRQALSYYAQTLALRETVGDRAGQAVTLTNIGRVYAVLGDSVQALAYYTQALPLHEATGDRTGQARTLSNIGRIYYDMGEPHQALAYFEQALPLRQAVGDRVGQAATLAFIGGVYARLGEPQQALAYYEQALAIEVAVGERAGQASTLNHIGEVYYTLGDLPRALDYYKQALPLRKAVGSRAGQAATLWNITQIYRQQGNLAEAERLLTQAVELAQAAESLQLPEMTAGLEQVRQERAAQAAADEGRSAAGSGSALPQDAPPAADAPPGPRSRA